MSLASFASAEIVAWILSPNRESGNAAAHYASCKSGCAANNTDCSEAGCSLKDRSSHRSVAPAELSVNERHEMGVKGGLTAPR